MPRKFIKIILTGKGSRVYLGGMSRSTKKNEPRPIETIIEEAEALRFSPLKLREARLAVFPGMSLNMFARTVAGISPQRLSQYERGNVEPSATLLARLCHLYQTDLLSLTERAP